MFMTRMLPRAELLAVLDSSRQSERRNLRDYKPDVAQKKDAQVCGKRIAASHRPDANLREGAPSPSRSPLHFGNHHDLASQDPLVL